MVEQNLASFQSAEINELLDGLEFSQFDFFEEENNPIIDENASIDKCFILLKDLPIADC